MRFCCNKVLDFRLQLHALLVALFLVFSSGIATAQVWSIGTGAAGDAVLKKDNRSFFPIGTYYVTNSQNDLRFMDQELPLMQDLGFDFIFSGFYPGAAETDLMIQDAPKHGITLATNAGYLTIPKLNIILQSAAGTPNYSRSTIPIFGLIDDAGPVPSDPISEIEMRESLVKTALPGALSYLSGVALNDENGEPWYKRFGGRTDIAGIQLYLIPEQELSKITTALRGFVEFQNSHGKVPVANLQIFGHDGHRLPYGWEFRNMVYQSLAVGVKGFFDYTFSDYLLDGSRRTLVTEHPANDELKSAIRTTNSEIKQLEGFLLEGARSEFNCGSDLTCARWEYQNECLFVAVNTKYDINEKRTVNLPLGSKCQGLAFERYAGSDSVSKNGAMLSGDLVGGDISIWYAYNPFTSPKLGFQRSTQNSERYYDIHDPLSNGLKINSIGVRGRKCIQSTVSNNIRFQCESLLASGNSENVEFEVKAEAPPGRKLESFAWYKSNANGTLQTFIGLTSRNTFSTPLQNNTTTYISAVASDDRGPSVYVISRPIQVDFTANLSGGTFVAPFSNSMPVTQITAESQTSLQSNCRRILLDASNSSDPDGGVIKRYFWYQLDVNFKRNIIGATNSPVISYSHCSNEALKVIVAIYDDEGPRSFSYSRPVDVLPQIGGTPGGAPPLPRAPRAIITGNYNDPVTDMENDGSEALMLDASGSYDPDGSELHYSWEVQNSDLSFTPILNTNLPRDHFTFSTSKRIALRLVVTDSIGLKDISEPVTLSFTRDKRNFPKLKIKTPKLSRQRSGKLMLNLDLSGSTASVSGGKITRYVITIPSSRKRYSNKKGIFSLSLLKGSYQVKFSITDDHKKTSTEERTIVVKNGSVKIQKLAKAPR